MSSVALSSLLKLCPKCQFLFDNWSEVVAEYKKGNFNYNIPHHSNIFELESSAAEGCILCIRFLDSIRPSDIYKLHAQEPTSSLHGVSVRSNATGKDGLEWSLSLRFPATRHNVVAESIMFPCSSAMKECIEPSTSSDLTLMLAKEWLDQCLSQHSECMESDGEISWPTRLVELKNDSIQVCEKALLKHHPPYVTLSHCWGDIETFKLTKETLEELHRGSVISKLCKTFQDAINITKRLGFRYIWIDSLCIIQDDEEDWRTEAVSMSTVYGNAILNVAASSAENGTIGCFFDRDVVKAQRHYMKATDGQLYEIIDTELYNRCLSRSSLSKRAWAFQERYLSRRTLHFTDEQIFWECGKQTACETYPKWIPPAACGDLSKYLHKEQIEDPWRNVVSLYSPCCLTYSKDKLVAIAGVARKLQKSTQEEYLAGLWRNDIELQLCWEVSWPFGGKCFGASLQEPPPFEYRAPSWSWASTDYPVDLHRRTGFGKTRLLCQFLDCSISHVTESQEGWGELKYARLRIRSSALLHGAVVVCHTRENSDDTAPGNIYKPGLNYVLGDGSFISKVKVVWDTGKPHHNIRGSVYFLPVYYTDDQKDSPFVAGLIITPSECRHQQSLFTRLGVFMIVLFESAEVFLKILPLRHPAEEVFADESIYEEVLGTNELGMQEYAITLI